MRVLRLNQRRIALLCAIILVGVSIAAVVREYLLSHQSNAPSVSQVTQQKPTVTTTPDATTSPSTSTQPVADNTDIVAPSPSPTASPTPTSTPTPTTSTQQDYSYTAQAGDSYTAFVRDALTQYTDAHALQLSADQQLYAEVAIVNAAGSPELEIGQVVVVTGAAIGQELSTIGITTAAATAKSSSTNSATVQKSNNDYVYTAQAGDSYTTLARQAITAYIQAKSIQLSAAQRIATESLLAATVGQPAIDVNQVITITSETIVSTIKQVQQLPADQIAVWQTYADSVAL